MTSSNKLPPLEATVEFGSLTFKLYTYSAKDALLILARETGIPVKKLKLLELKRRMS